MKQRLLSLDVMRGMTVFFMIIVNNGVGPDHYDQLDHSRWNGLTCCDLVFPFFLFMVGVSIWFSLGGRKSDGRTHLKILGRTLRMFLIGVALHAWDAWVGGKSDILAHLRVWGVLERIALCYGIVSLLVLYVHPRQLWKFIIGLLVLYGVLLLVGNGYAQDESNWASMIDRAICGPDHLYHKSAVDPEGLMGTISAVAHTLLGVCVGYLVKGRDSLTVRMLRMLMVAWLLIVLGGLVMAVGFPLNKRIWSPSYVLVTCALATFLLVLLTFLIDGMRLQRWSRLFQAFGMNAFFLYVLSEMLAPVAGRYEVGDWLYVRFHDVMSSPLSSLCYSLLFVLVVAIPGWILFRKKIFIKI